MISVAAVMIRDIITECCFWAALFAINIKARCDSSKIHFRLFNGVLRGRNSIRVTIPERLKKTPMSKFC